MPNQGMLSVNIASTYACGEVHRQYRGIYLPHTQSLLRGDIAAAEDHQLHHRILGTQVLSKGS